MNSRRISVLCAVLAVGVGACGDDSDDSSKSSNGTPTETERALPPKAALEEAAAIYNRGYERFADDFQAHTSAGDFDAVKADIAAFRTVIFELDKRIRAIQFDASRQAAVNQILEKNRELIARLDAIRETNSFAEAIPVYKEALKARAASVNAINKLLEKL